MSQTIQGNPAHGWEERQDHGETVIVRFAPRAPGAGWDQLTVEHAVRREADRRHFSAEDVPGNADVLGWNLSLDQLGGRRVQRGDWIEAGGEFWCVLAGTSQVGSFGREQRPIAAKIKGGELPWLI